MVVDSGLRAESQALANLLDDPAVHTAVLLAHNGDDSANPIITVAHGRLVPGGDGVDRPAAGIPVVANRDCPAFADAVQRAARVAESGARAPAWEIAVGRWRDAASVQAVEAAPFCASRSAMDLPDRGEDDRRLRPRQLRTMIWRLDLRCVRCPAASPGWRSSAAGRRRLSPGPGWAPGRWQHSPPSRPSESARCRGSRARSASWWPTCCCYPTANSHAIGAAPPQPEHASTACHARRRGAGPFGLAMASAGSGTPAWLLTATALGLLAVNAHAVTARAAVGDDRSSSYRGLRWLLVSIAWLFAGPAGHSCCSPWARSRWWARLTVRAMSDLRAPQSEPDRSTAS